MRSGFWSGCGRGREKTAKKKAANSSIKPFQELTIKDDFMFGAVMSDEENCRGLLERILEIEISEVHVDLQKTLTYNPSYRGIRMDVVANDAENTKYDIEMQVVPHAGLDKRTRYYHSQIDMDMLDRGVTYEQLPNAYVIFICDFDPFKERLYRYTFHMKCEETEDMRLQDGTTTVFLSTKGTNRQDVSEELVSFLKYVEADLKGSEADFQDAYIRQIQNTDTRVKSSREMGDQYMKLQLLLQEKYAAGKAEGRAEGIEEQAKRTVLKLLAKDTSIEEIADIIGVEAEIVRQWIGEAM